MAGAVSTAPRHRTEAAAAHPRLESARALAPAALAVPLLLVAGALALRLYELDHEPLWLDEGYTLLFSRLSLAKLFLVGGAHEHPPLYYLLVHSALAFDNWYLVPRIISAVAGALAVFAVYLLGAQLRGRLTGLIAASLAAVAPFHVWYSRDARGYELAGLLVVLSYLFLFRSLDQPHRLNWALYAVCLALSLYAEYTTIFVLLPQTLLYLQARRRKLGRPLVLSWVGALILFLPWIGTLALDALGIAGDYWIPAPTATEVSNTALEFLGVMTPCPSSPCSGHLLLPNVLSGVTGVIAAGAAGFSIGLGLWAVFRRSLTVGVLLLWLTFPFAVVLFIALFRSLYLDRIFL